MWLIKAILAGLLAGALVFGWNFLAHRFFPLGQQGVTEMAPESEKLLMQQLEQLLPTGGLFVFPSIDHQAARRDAEAANELYRERYREGPSGLLVHGKPNPSPNSYQRWLAQLACDVGLGLLVALLASFFSSRAKFLVRWLLIASLALVAFLATDAGYAIWHGFPSAYYFPQLAIKLVGFSIMGLVLALVIRPPRPISADEINA